MRNSRCNSSKNTRGLTSTYRQPVFVRTRRRIMTALPCHLSILPRVRVASTTATRLPGLRVCPIVTITTFPHVILLSVPPLLPTSAPPWPMLCQFPSGRHYPCHPPPHPRANWLPDQAVSLAYTHSDRKSSHLASLS